MGARWRQFWKRRTRNQKGPCTQSECQWRLLQLAASTAPLAAGFRNPGAVQPVLPRRLRSVCPPVQVPPELFPELPEVVGGPIQVRPVRPKALAEQPNGGTQ